MKNLIIIYILLLHSLISSDIQANDLWNNIRNKTWTSSEEEPFGAHIIFLEDNVSKKAIQQFQGSGCYVIMTLIYEVEINRDTVKLVLDLMLTPQQDSIINTNINRERLKFIYSKNKKLIPLVVNDNQYRIMSDKPFLYRQCSQVVDIEEITKDNIDYDDFY